jgi:hypothetical protein
MLATQEDYGKNYVSSQFYVTGIYRAALELGVTLGD